MKFKIESESFLGMGHCGSVSAEGTGFVELDENEVSQLVDLIREKNTTDVEELGLQKLYPAVYEKLAEAYGDVAHDATLRYWLWDGYCCGDAYDYDYDELKSYCKWNCGFDFEYDEDDYRDDDGSVDKRAIEEAEDEAFNSWFEDFFNQMDVYEAKYFFEEHLNAEIYVDDVDFEVKIPEGVIEMARN